MKRIVITEYEKGHRRFPAYLMLDERREPEAFQLFSPEEETVVGSIYVGYVEKVAANVNAAFVRIGGGQKCYLPLEDLKSPVFVRKQSEKKALCEGDELLVQVTKEAVKTKDAAVSTKLTLHGTYCFLTTDNTRIGVSRKIPADRAQELSALAHEVCGSYFNGACRPFGLVLRTNAKEQSDAVLREDIEDVLADYVKIMTTGIHQRQGELVCRSLPGYLARLKGEDLSEVDRICTDVPAFYEQIAERLPALAADGKLQLYQDDAVSLAALYSLNRIFDCLLAQKVWLPSGANIIIETLETLTVIDVNSGKNISRKAQALFSINMEAAGEIARQLRLRNISGMIIVDFINMESEEQKEALIACLKAELAKDTVPARFVDITKLGLIELTRKKVYKSLREILS